MNNFEHLKGLVVTDKREGSKTIKNKESKNPEGLTLRIYANGDVYPSQALINEYDLNYYNKGSQSGSGFDVIDSKEWTPFKNEERMIMFGLTSKHYPKVDLFATTRFNSDDTPISNPLTQGSPCKKLLNLVTEMGYLIPGMKYVDLTIVNDVPLTTEDGIAFIPKTFEKGDKAGQPTYERRENETFYPVTVKNPVKQLVEETIEQSNN